MNHPLILFPLFLDYFRFLSVNIITERKFPFNENDYSILETNENNGTKNEYTRHFEQINHRRNSTEVFLVLVLVGMLI